MLCHGWRVHAGGSKRELESEAHCCIKNCRPPLYCPYAGGPAALPVPTTLLLSTTHLLLSCRAAGRPAGGTVGSTKSTSAHDSRLQGAAASWNAVWPCAEASHCFAAAMGLAANDGLSVVGQQTQSVVGVVVLQGVLHEAEAQITNMAHTCLSLALI